MKRIFAVSLILLASSCGGDSAPNLGFIETFNQNGSVVGLSYDQFAHSSEDELEGYDIKITSEGASSGYVKLNGAQILGPSSFKNKSFEAIKAISLKTTNKLEAFISGQPGDQICVEITQHMTDHDHLIYERCVDREKGKPQVVEATIDLDQ